MEGRLRDEQLCKLISCSDNSNVFQCIPHVHVGPWPTCPLLL